MGLAYETHTPLPSHEIRRKRIGRQIFSTDAKKKIVHFQIVGIDKQIPESLSRKDCAPIIEEPRGVTWGAYIFVVLYSGHHHHADPQTPLLGGCPPHHRYL